jgi:hypothetical protein
MQEDALEPLDNSGTSTTPIETFSPEVLEESIQFLRLQVPRPLVFNVTFSNWT